MNWQAILAGVATLILALVTAFFVGRSQGKKVVVPAPKPEPSPLQKEQDAKVQEALKRAEEARQAALAAAEADREKALQQAQQVIAEDTKKLSEDPAALAAYLLEVGKSVRNER